jgi:hypothetical protein
MMDPNQVQQGQGRPEKGQAEWSTQGQQGLDDLQHMLADRGLQTTAEVALRGAAMLWDLQMETARNLTRTHARTAAILGVPDYSEFFRVGDEHARRIMSVSAEQILNSARQARDTVVEVQRHLGRLAEQQVTGLTEEVRKQIEQLGRQTEQRLQELRELAVTQADQVNNAARQAIDAVAEARRQGSAQAEQGRAYDDQASQLAQDIPPVAEQPQAQPVSQQAERSELWVPASATDSEVQTQSASGDQQSGLHADPAPAALPSALILPETIEPSMETAAPGKLDAQHREGRSGEDRPRSRRVTV